METGEFGGGIVVGMYFPDTCICIPTVKTHQDRHQALNKKTENWTL